MLLALLLQTAAPRDTNPLNWLQNALQGFNDAHAGMFISIGSSLYTSFALILIVWTGIQIAMSGNFQAFQVARLLMILAFGKALIVYYAGGDYSISELVLGQARYLGDRIDTNAFSLLGDRAAQSWTALGNFSPSLTNPTDVIWYFVALAAFVALQVVALFVIAFGDIACAVCVMLGPLFIPFFIVPKLDWLFWGWFRAFLQYAFYRVVASAVLLIIANAANTMTSYLPSSGVEAPSGWEFTPTVLFAFVAVLVLLKVPVLTASIFSGSAGSDGNIIGTMQSAARSAVVGAAAA